jgi:ribosomal protein S18 acetylase RimI-like enzyme
MTSLAHRTVPSPDRQVRLAPASQFTIEEITLAYNQTRIDYMVPMPMNVARLASYVKVYDIDMERSWVAVDGDKILGLAMLGVRPGRTWVTRLGVLPVHRRAGTGEALTRALLAETRALGRPAALLEVIKGNQPAHALFQKVGFRETRELYILRRPPGQPPGDPPGRANWLEKEEALDLLCGHPVRPAWTNEIDSFINAGDAQGLEVHLGGGERGWMAFRRQKFLLSHFVLRTESGDPRRVAGALVAHLYSRFPHIDTFVENVPASDEHLPALMTLGFMEVFRRVEMELAGLPGDAEDAPPGRLLSPGKRGIKKAARGEPGKMGE